MAHEAGHELRMRFGSWGGEGAAGSPADGSPAGGMRGVCVRPSASFHALADDSAPTARSATPQRQRRKHQRAAGAKAKGPHTPHSGRNTPQKWRDLAAPSPTPPPMRVQDAYGVANYAVYPLTRTPTPAGLRMQGARALRAGSYTPSSRASTPSMRWGTPTPTPPPSSTARPPSRGGHTPVPVPTMLSAEVSVLCGVGSRVLAPCAVVAACAAAAHRAQQRIRLAAHTASTTRRSEQSKLRRYTCDASQPLEKLCLPMPPPHPRPLWLADGTGCTRSGTPVRQERGAPTPVANRTPTPPAQYVIHEALVADQEASTSTPTPRRALDFDDTMRSVGAAASPSPQPRHEHTARGKRRRDVAPRVRTRLMTPAESWDKAMSGAREAGNVAGDVVRGISVPELYLNVSTAAGAGGAYAVQRVGRGPPRSPAGAARETVSVDEEHDMRQLYGALKRDGVVTMHGENLDAEMRQSLLDILYALHFRKEDEVQAQGMSLPGGASARGDADADDIDSLTTSDGLSPHGGSRRSRASRGRSSHSAVSDAMSREAWGINMSEPAWIQLTTRIQRWLHEIRERLALRARDARLDSCEAAVVRQRLNSVFRQWRGKALAEVMYRQRRLRQAWLGWHEYLRDSETRRRDALLQLGHSIALISQWKCFFAWSRYVEVERKYEPPPHGYFAAEPAFPVWDAFFLDYLRMRSRETQLKVFHQRWLCLRCLWALRDYTLERRDEKQGELMVQKFVTQCNTRVVQRVFAVMRWRMECRSAALSYSMRLTQQAFLKWRKKFQYHITLQCYERHWARRSRERLLRSRMTHWMERCRQAALQKLLICVRCMLFRDKMLLIIYYMRSGPHYRLLQVFRVWSHSIKRHSKFVVFVNQAVAVEDYHVLRAAFHAWWEKKPYVPPGFPWEAADRLRSAMRMNRHLGAEQIEVELNKTRTTQERLIMGKTKKMHYHNWISGMRQSASLMPTLLRRLLLWSIAMTEIRRRDFAQDPAEAAAADDEDECAWRLDKYRVGAMTERQALLHGRLVTKTSSRNRINLTQQNLAATKAILELVPQYRTAAGGLNRTALLSWLLNGFRTNRKLAALQTYRDRLLVEPQGRRIPGLDNQAYDQLRLRVRAVCKIIAFFQMRCNVGLVTRHDVAALKGPAVLNKSRPRKGITALFDKGFTAPEVLKMLRRVLRNPEPLAEHVEIYRLVEDIFDEPRDLEQLFHTRAARVFGAGMRVKRTPNEPQNAPAPGHGRGFGGGSLIRTASLGASAMKRASIQKRT